ncbi:GDNF family receptor alpha-4-like isoform X2 [Engraulis encrasicolus]
MDMRRSCLDQRQCRHLYDQLDACVENQASGTLEPEERQGCLEVQSALLQVKRHLLDCRCQRGSRKEERCLRIYWTFRFPQGYDDIESSPYDDIEEELRRSLDIHRIASFVTASLSPSLDGQSACLKAAQDCGVFEKCGALRSEYALACTKPAGEGSDHCNRQRCHRTLRRFLERVPEDYSLPLLFCPCADPLCGERRRKTIVPSCSHEDHERGRQPNCLHLRGLCLKDDLCKARLADFQHHCQPSPLSFSPSGCARESRAMCLKAYTGLIGTLMTPNYVSNSSMDVSLWCNCEGSGNHWEDCQHFQRIFTQNTCLSSSISTMGSFEPVEEEDDLVPPTPAPSQLTQHHLNVNLHFALNSVETSEEDKEAEEDHLQDTAASSSAASEADGGRGEEELANRIPVIPSYSEKATVSNLNSAAWSLHHPGTTTSITLSLQRHLVLSLLLCSALTWVLN